MTTSGTAILLAHGCFDNVHGKTAHALVRGGARFDVLGVVDPQAAGAGERMLPTGDPARRVPLCTSVDELLARVDGPPQWCVVGVATAGGRLPEAVRAALHEVAARGISLVNGLHELLTEDETLVATCARTGAQMIDLRRPRPRRELHFWRGAVFEVKAPRIAVLGMDCAIGKRTTTTMLQEALERLGARAGMIHTGQTGWMLGIPHGFVLDATPNDFVSGELEHAIVQCAHDLDPDVILLEGQSALRNPSGPCGSELIVSGAVAGVILQHAPHRPWFLGMEGRRPHPPLSEEIELIRLLGAEVWAVTLNVGDAPSSEGRRIRDELRAELACSVFLARDDIDDLAELVRERLAP